jgi:hypothetical protein
VSTFYTNFLYKNTDVTVWEDVYGRSVPFFILAIIFIMTSPHSLFDIPKNVRTKMFAKIILDCAGFVLFLNAIFQCQHINLALIVLCIQVPFLFIASSLKMGSGEANIIVFFFYSLLTLFGFIVLLLVDDISQKVVIRAFGAVICTVISQFLEWKIGKKLEGYYIYPFYMSLSLILSSPSFML